MRSSVVQKTLTGKAAVSATPTTICIVDPQTSSSTAPAELSNVRVERVATAEQALRFARTQPVDLWVVNTELPGLSGYELCSMLKARSSRSAVCLVANEYSIETEQQAWAARASMFLCKAESADWLEKLCNQFGEQRTVANSI